MSSLSCDVWSTLENKCNVKKKNIQKWKIDKNAPGQEKKSKNRQIYRRRCAPAKKYLQLFNTIQNKLEDSGLTIFKNKNVKKKNIQK